jgi:hypothetical protein
VLECYMMSDESWVELLASGVAVCYEICGGAD